MNLAVPLPLNAIENKIVPGARTALGGVQIQIQTEIVACTTPASRIAFWRSLHSYAGRNLEAVSAPAATTATAKPAPARPAGKAKTNMPAKAAGRKTRSAGSST